MLVLIIIAVAFAMPRFKRIQTLTDNLNRVTRENLTGLRVVRAYNAEGYQEGKFQEANQALTSNNLAANRVMAIMFPGMNLVMNGLTLAIYWIGAYLIGAIPLPARRRWPSGWESSPTWWSSPPTPCKWWLPL